MRPYRILLQIGVISLVASGMLIIFPSILDSIGNITLYLLIAVFGISVILVLFRFWQFMGRNGINRSTKLGPLIILVAGSYLLILGFSPYMTHHRMIISNSNEDAVYNVYIQGCLQHHASILGPGESRVIWVPDLEDCSIDLRYRSSRGLWWRGELNQNAKRINKTIFYEIGNESEQLIE